jgi:hypothetical protein
MVSNHDREAIGTSKIVVVAGAPADLMAIDAASRREAIADAPMASPCLPQRRAIAS